MLTNQQKPSRVELSGTAPLQPRPQRNSNPEVGDGDADGDGEAHGWTWHMADGTWQISQQILRGSAWYGYEYEPITGGGDGVGVKVAGNKIRHRWALLKPGRADPASWRKKQTVEGEGRG